MTHEIIIIQTVPAHIRMLAASLREDDRKEVTCFGMSANKVLWQTYRASFVCKTAFIDGVIAAVWGICGAPLGTVGHPFLLTTPQCEVISPLKFARIYQKEVLSMLKIFPTLVNYVAAEYHKSIRLLDLIGFRLDDPKPLGVYNAMFRKFTMEAR